MNINNIEVLEKLVTENVILPLRKDNKKNLNILRDNMYLNVEVVNLLFQSSTSISIIHKLLNSGNIVDSATLMRSCMDKIMMAMMIYFDPINTYEDFKHISKCGKTEYTRPFCVLKNFSLRLKEINTFLFDDFSDEELKDMLEDTYEKLCLYTHSSVCVSMMIEVQKNKDENLFVAFFSFIAYFLELLLYSCLKYLNKDDERSIDGVCLSLGIFILFKNVDYKKVSPEYLEKYKKYIHWEINGKISKKNQDIIKKMSEDFLLLCNEIRNNSEVIDKYLEDLL